MYNRTPTNKWIRIFMASYFVICLSVIIFGVTMTTKEETPEVRTIENTETVQHIKATMPEIDIETLEKSLVHFSNKPEPIKEYSVKSGENLWYISELIYGDGSYYPYLMKVNNLTKETVYEGQILTIKYFSADEEEAILEECYEYMRNQKKTNSKPSSNARNYNTAENITFVGNYKITGYDPYCVHCCGKSDGITASGNKAKIGKTIAAKGFKFGTKLYIEGYGIYVVEDSGAFKPTTIDIAASSHDECYNLTSYNVPVYIVND